MNLFIICMEDKQTDQATPITIRSRFVNTADSNSVNAFTFFYRISTQRKSNLCFAHSQEEKFLITGKTHKGTRFYFLSNVITICSAEIKKMQCPVCDHSKNGFI